MKKLIRRGFLVILMVAVVVISVVHAEPSEPAYNAARSFSPSNEILINPHIGFQTFQGFNGFPYGIFDCNFTESMITNWNGNLTNPNDYPDSSVAYVRVYWCYIEPKEGEYNRELMDRLLRLAKQRGQTLMFRLMPYDARPDVPAWYRAMVPDETRSVARPGALGAPDTKTVGTIEERGGHGWWNVDHNNPLFVERWNKLVKWLGENYDGHPYLDSVDIAYCGPWGEQQGATLIKQELENSMIKTYTDNFKKTPLVALTHNSRGHIYAIDQGVVPGFRADSFGDMGYVTRMWTHMTGNIHPSTRQTEGVNGYAEHLNAASDHVQKVLGTPLWQKGIVSFELASVFESWYTPPAGYAMKERFNIDHIIQQGKEWHTSTLNGKNSRIPAEWRSKFDEWLKVMGYRFSLKEVEYTDTVAQAGDLLIKSTWYNLGTAPLYHKGYPLAFRLAGSNGSEEIFLSGADIMKWMPGYHDPGKWVHAEPFVQTDIHSHWQPGKYNEPEATVVQDSFKLPNSIAVGDYELQVSILQRFMLYPDEFSKVPGIKLANTGLGKDGWLAIGKVKITAP